MSVILEMKTIINVIIVCNSNRPFAPGELKNCPMTKSAGLNSQQKKPPKNVRRTSILCFMIRKYWENKYLMLLQCDVTTNIQLSFKDQCEKLLEKSITQNM